MILLTDVAAKLQELLNSYAPTDYLFVVKSAGYHLDSIADKNESRNTIPVFVSMVGGEYDPVPNLHQINFTYEINIYFPVRFKEDFYNINQNLEQWFVGKKVNYGSENALCNISAAEYGEIENLQFSQFENWIMEEYADNVHLFKNEYEINEPYMSMKFRLFCTTLGEGFLFGNDVKYELSVKMPDVYATSIQSKYNNGFYTFDRYAAADGGGKYAFRNTSLSKILFVDSTIWSLFTTDMNIYSYMDNDFVVEKDENGKPLYQFSLVLTYYVSNNLRTYVSEIVWDQSGTGASISPISEQLVGTDKYVRNVPNITNFNKSFLAYVKNTEFWKNYLLFYNLQQLEQITNITLTKIYSFENQPVRFVFNQIMLSHNENVELGSPLSFTITFGD